MAIGDPYATLAQFKKYLNVDADKVSNDERLTDALMSATAEVELHTGRQFNKDTVASARLFTPDSSRSVLVDDFWTTEELTIRSRSGYGSTSFGSFWGADDYELLPLDGVKEGQNTWPYNRIHSINHYLAVPKRGNMSRVEVTAKWGWNAVPAPIKQATLILAAQNYKMSEAPFGVAGFNEYGVVRVRDLPQVASKLRPYRVTQILVG